jgi:transcriptional accessory protein Tex/SPT6
MIDLHTQDNSQAFIKFSDVEEKLTIGERLYVTITEK